MYCPLLFYLSFGIYGRSFSQERPDNIRVTLCSCSMKTYGTRLSKNIGRFYV